MVKKMNNGILFELPFVHMVNLKPRGKKSPVTIDVLDSMPVLVPDRSGDLKPVLHIGATMSADGRNQDISDYERTYYSDGNSVWYVDNTLPTSSPEQVIEDIKSKILQRALQYHSGKGGSRSYELAQSLDSLHDLTMGAEPKFREFDNNAALSKKKAIEDLEEKLSHYCIVDGKLATRASPEHSLRMFANKRAPASLVLSKNLSNSYDVSSYDYYYGLDQLELAQECLQEAIRSDRIRGVVADEYETVALRYVDENRHLLSSSLKNDYAVRWFDATVYAILHNVMNDIRSINLTPRCMTAFREIIKQRNICSQEDNERNQISPEYVLSVLFFLEEINHMVFDDPEFVSLVSPSEPPPVDNIQAITATVGSVSARYYALQEGASMDRIYEYKSTLMKHLETSMDRLVRERPDVLPSPDILSYYYDAGNKRLLAFDRFWERALKGDGPFKKPEDDTDPSFGM